MRYVILLTWFFFTVSWNGYVARFDFNSQVACESAQSSVSIMVGKRFTTLCVYDKEK